MSIRTCYDRYINVKLSLIVQVILHEMATLVKNKTSPTVEWLFRVARLQIVVPGRSVLVPDVVGHVSLYLHQAQTLRGTEMAANRKRHSYCYVTTIRQTRHFRFWRRQISRWRRRWFRQTEGTAFSRLLLSFNVCTLRLGMLLSCTRIGLPCYCGTAVCATFAYVLCTMHVNMRGIKHRLYSTMSDSVHRFLYQVYQVCCGVRVY